MEIFFHMLMSTASGLAASTYGFAEMSCGDVGKPVSCAHGAVTASGETFKPHQVPSAALAAPFTFRLTAKWIYIKLVGPYPCRRVRLNDKMNPRFIGQRGFDLSPAAVKLLTSRPAKPYWSSPVEVCY